MDIEVLLMVRKPKESSGRYVCEDTNFGSRHKNQDNANLKWSQFGNLKMI